MGVISMIGSILEALGDAGGTSAGTNQKRIPAEKLKVLLREGKQREAVMLLRTTMGWSADKSQQFIASVKNTANNAVPNSPALRNRTSTQIDALLKDHQRQENNGGSSLFEYFLTKFKNK